MDLKKITALLTTICFLTSFTGQNFAYAAPGGKAESAVSAGIKPDIFAERFGKITEYENYGSGQVIVTIQDLHAHPQTQKNIAAILQALDEKYQIKRVYAEGASGKVDMSWLSSYGVSETRQNIVAQMVNDGALTGAEYFAFLNKKNNLYGLEDAKVHRQNIARLGAIYENQDKNLSVAASVKNEIAYLSNKNLSLEMKQFSKASAEYHGNKMEAAKYYKILLGYAEKINQNPLDYSNAFNINPEEFTELKKVAVINEMSKKLNAKHINSQLQQYLSGLKDSLSVSEYHALMESTDNLNDIDSFFKFISARGGIDEKGNSQLAAFMKVRELNSQVNPLDLFAQEQKLEEQLRRSLASSEIERETAFLNDFYVYFEGYLTNKLTAKDEEYFKNNFGVFSRLYGKYASVNRIDEIKSQFSFFNDYYDTNNKRNEIFVEKINEHDKLVPGENRSAQSPESILNNAKEIIVIVTGGYHTLGVNEILASKNISHITITPKISESTALAEINYRQIIIDQSKIYKEALAFVIASQTPNAQQFQKIAEAGAAYLGKDISFDNLDELVDEIDNIIGAEGTLPVNRIDANNAEIKFVNGASIFLSRGPNNEILLKNEASRAAESVEAGAVKISDKTVTEAYFNFAATLIPEVSKGLYGIAVLDIENDNIYQVAKEFFVAKAKEGTVFEEDREIAALEEYARVQMKSGETLDQAKERILIDAITYETLSTLPPFFQKEALKRQIEKDLSDKGTPKKQKSLLSKLFTKILALSLTLMFVFVSLTACGQSGGDTSQTGGSPIVVEQPATPTDMQPAIPPALKNDYVRKVAQEFMQGNPLPRSFVGNTNIIGDPVQKTVAEQGVIIYDMSVLMKALLLYPEENKDLITTMFNALEQNKNSNTTNRDFTYGDNDGNHSVVPVGQGYYWKILSTKGGWLENQSQPITGENAWLGNAFVSMANAYQGSDLGDRAYKRSVELAKAVLALQTTSGAIRMAPKDVVANYSYLGIDYYQTASLENNVSAYSFLKNLHDFTNDAKLKSDIAAALPKLEDYIFSMYDKDKGYFLSGTNLSTNVINKDFATDCQTWIISVFGAKTFNEKMKARFGVDNASIKILRRALELSGVKENGQYIGLDFTTRAQIVSFEWTLGWLAAAKEALLYSEDAEFRSYVDGIDAYVKSNVDSNRLLKYINSDKIEITFSWYGLPLPSLAASSWMLFNPDLGEKKLIINPFEVFQLSSQTAPVSPQTPTQPQTPSAPATTPEDGKPQTGTEAKTINTDAVKMYGDSNWRAYALQLGKISLDAKGELSIEIETLDAAPNSKAIIEIRNIDDKGVVEEPSNILLKEPYKLAENGGKVTIKIPYSAISALNFGKNVELVISVGRVFNGNNLNEEKNASIKITGAAVQSAGLELPFFAFILNKLGITKQKYPQARAAIIAAVEAPFILLLPASWFVRMHGKTTPAIEAARLAGASEMKDQAIKYMGAGAAFGAGLIVLFSASLGLGVGTPIFGIFGISVILQFSLSIVASLFVAALPYLAAWTAVVGLGSLIRSHFSWNLANPKTTLDNNVQVNMIYATKENLPRFQQHYGTGAVVNDNGTVSQNVFILNSNVDPVAEGFVSSGMKVNGKTVFVKSSASQGIIYYAENAQFRDISAAVQNKTLENKVRRSLKFGHVYLGNTMNADYMDVDAVSGVTGTEYDAVTGRAILHAGAGTEFMQYNAASFDRARDMRNAEGSQRARSIMIYLHKTRTLEAFENYMKILKNVSNGNLIITEELVSQMISANKLEPILEQLRKDGISVMIEQTAQTNLTKEIVNLFDGKFSTQTGKIESNVPAQGNVVLDVDMIKSGDNMEESLKRSNKNVVIFESAIEEYVENNRSGLGQFLEDITSVKILKYFASAPVTAESAGETARNFDIEKIMNDFSNITQADVKAMYEALQSGMSAENMFLLNDRVNVNSSARMYLEKIESRVQNAAELQDIKKAYMKGLMEKLAAAVEFKNAGRTYGFKNKNTEKLVGQLASFKYLPVTASESEAAAVRTKVDNMTAKNYNNEIAVIINEKPLAIPLVTELLLSMIFAYESEVKLDKKDLKREPNLKAINAILKAA